MQVFGEYHILLYSLKHLSLWVGLAVGWSTDSSTQEVQEGGGERKETNGTEISGAEEQKGEAKAKK